MKNNLRVLYFTLFFAVAAGIFPTLSAFAAPATGSTSTGNLEKEIKQEEQKLQKIQKQINEYDKKKNVAAEQEKKVIKDLNSLSSKMSKAEQLLNITVLKRNQVAGKITEILSQIDSTSKHIDEAKRLLGGRIVAMYKYGGMAEFNLLMSATGAQEALSTQYMLSKIAKQDMALIDDLYSQKQVLDKAHSDLVNQKAELESRDNELKKQKDSIRKTTQDRNKLLQQVRKDKALFQAQQAELLRASKELQQKVQQLLSEKKKQQQQNRGGETPLYYKGGRLAWPLRGAITSPYGSRIHPVFKTRTTHTGLDIDGNKGDPVRAAADGEILYTGWLRGYGQVVIVDHGGNLTTVYAHLSGIDTTENAKIKTGEKIGRVGSTGVATGNHLHFEVRVNGNTTDPLTYLNKY
ncbi:MAG: peptidoglycan DD-metalloendopeptidase family protein [Synergistaceae bacterium]|jgi:murein DD-endopeptidase MepM/ murein hydrolase activator NlpD|nr:peptidoglycan DD-metalloendopeptidase family protein [Synergistaceae bacterium]